jgi:AAA+ ATPase superfamily predicted ATPase
MVTIELDKNELKDILDSIDLMIQDRKRKLLDKLPSDESDRQQLEVYYALREIISKAWRSIR